MEWKMGSTRTSIHETRAMGRSEMFWGSSGDALARAGIETCHGEWIFSCKTGQESTKMLTHIFERIEAGWIRRCSRDPFEWRLASWRSVG